MKFSIIAHRGASRFAPENTLAAFRRAIVDGADGIELDARLAKDGVPVVFHDSTLERTANEKARVSDFTAAELQKIKVGMWFNRTFPRAAREEFSSETVRTLAQTLDFLGKFNGSIYIELKGKISEMPALVQAVCALIRQNGLTERTVVKSFKLDALKFVKDILPDVRTAALFSPKVLYFLGKRERILERAEACGADEISLHYSLATRRFVERARAKNISTIVWTVDNPIWIRRALDLNIAGVITNNPARLVKKRTAVLRKTVDCV